MFHRLICHRLCLLSFNGHVETNCADSACDYLWVEFICDACGMPTGGHIAEFASLVAYPKSRRWRG